MKLAAACVLFLVSPVASAYAAPKPLPKDCPRAFVKAWDNRGSAAALPKPKEPCVLRGETGMYLCDDRGCARP